MFSALENATEELRQDLRRAVIVTGAGEEAQKLDIEIKKQLAKVGFEI